MNLMMRILLIACAAVAACVCDSSLAAEPATEPSMPAVRLTCSRSGHLFVPGEDVELTLTLTANPSQPIEVEATLIDLDDRPAARVRTRLPAVAGDASAVPLRFDSPGLGHYRARVTAGEALLAETTLAVLPPAERSGLLPESPFGTIAQLSSVDPTQLDERIALMARAGVRWAREGFLWQRIEPTEGQFDWSTYDRIVETSHHHGISVLPVLAYGTDWASTAPADASPSRRRTTMPRIEAWERFVRAVVERYHDRIDVWEIWNEPNSTTFFAPAPGQEQADCYVQLLTSAYRVIKEVDPSAKVLIGGFTPKHWLANQAHLHERLFMERIFAVSPVPFDIAATHPYTAPNHKTAHSATVAKLEHLASFVRDPMVERGEAARPIWFTECGTPTMPSILTEREAANYMVVLLTHALSQDYVGKVFWYNFRDLGTKPTEKEHHFGLLLADLAPKPTYLAYWNLTRLLERARFIERQTIDDAQIYRFESPEQRVAVIWADDERPVTIPAGEAVRVLDVIGREAAAGSENGMLKVTASRSPLFIIEPAGKP